MTRDATATAAVHYPESDEMGESMLQRLIAELLRPLLARFLAERGERAFVGADQFIYWVEGDPSRRIAPDVYVIFGEDPSAEPRSWLLWETRQPPAFALEIVGQDVAKDYDSVPSEYEAAGVDELIVFDPASHEPARRPRVRWQIWRRQKDGRLLCEERTNDDRVYARSLRCWLRCVRTTRSIRLRVATGEHGEALVETDAERADRERRDKERERREKERALVAEEAARQRAQREREEKEREREEKERERAARIALEQELERLRCELAKR
jgi:hypothetical protein